MMHLLEHSPAQGIRSLGKESTYDPDDSEKTLLTQCAVGGILAGGASFETFADAGGHRFASDACEPQAILMCCWRKPACAYIFKNTRRRWGHVCVG